ncbi:MAG TPA: hypothetical protein VMX16_02945 [Terriglobia bacterium]|nr:hypothetical protein [Terriglobia bacterium]
MSGLLMHALQYAVYGIELALGAALILKRRWRTIKGFSIYVFGLLCSDAVLRPVVLYRFGWSSSQYRYVYWSTDVLLTLGAFLLISCLFKRACEDKDELWASLRLGLSAVFVIVLVISFYSFSGDHSKAFASFILNFQQNLYFVCLVLNTLLYVMMQQIACSDDYLGLLVCGLGIQFAGPAASFALIHLTPGDHSFVTLAYYVGPMCTLGMLLSWLYAVTREPQSIPARAPRRRQQVPVLAE